MSMILQFDPNQDYQRAAIKAVTDLFEGQPKDDTLADEELREGELATMINGIRNRLVLTEEQLLTNLRAVQQANDIAVSDALDGMHFAVEMETGTGKTYVYLRTIYELNRQYGFKKFVIVVPSVAIREGVIKNLEITQQHFQTLYDRTSLHFSVYSSTKASTLRSFATADNIEVLVMNIDAFAKDENIINKVNDKLNGQRPVEFIKETNPIVIVDEPQNMETEKRVAAIANLNPLCTLRYSATHTKKYNLVYSLNPVKAYDLGLVKQIAVDSVMEENAFNDAFIVVEGITAAKTKVMGKLTIHTNGANGVVKKSVSVKVGDDLYKLSNGREVYANGYIVEEIDVSNQCLSLSNGTMLNAGESQGGMGDEVMRVQIRKTVEEHLKKEKRLLAKGIKVLSLFFIDKVANYRQYDEAGNVAHGKFAIWFEEVYRELVGRPAYAELDRFPIKDIHNGYFSQDKKGKVKDTSGETQADDDTYSLIMRDKEKLLGIDNPLRFIFSHSALREGWDNPNVFQICTLNETKSDVKKRQEIGRGLRLAVDQSGQRTYDRNINQLTVVANESYDDFAKALQKEIEEDCGVKFTGRIKNNRDKTALIYRKGFEADPRFLEIWDKLRGHTTYRVDYSTEDLIREAAKAVKELPEVKAPSIRSSKGAISITGTGVATQHVAESVERWGGTWSIPDVLGYIQSKTELTRSTLFSILNASGRASDILTNPQLFLDLASQAIRRTLYALMIEGIKYERIGDKEYEMLLFKDGELEFYRNEFTFAVSDSSKTIYEEWIPLDSGVESQFAKDCEANETVRFYFKLPSEFKLPTPIGSYNPDWAIVFEGDTKIYFVAETKSTGGDTVDLSKLSMDEQMKIKCGRAHFKEVDGVDYKVVRTVAQLVD